MADNVTTDSEDARAALSRKVGASCLWVLSCTAQEAQTALLAGCDEACVRRMAPLDGMPVRCNDLREAGRSARERGEVLVVDVTVPGLFCCDALRLGAHVCVMELDEDLSLIALSRDARAVLPSALQALDTLPLASRGELGHATELLEAQVAHWRAVSDVAQVVAAYLRCHPIVEDVRYPGLRGDPSYEVAARTLQRGFGPLVDYLTNDGTWHRFAATARDAREQVIELERGALSGGGHDAFA